MSYIDDNKKAWEQAFMHRSGAYVKDLTKRLELNDVSFFHKDFLEELNAYPFENKSVICGIKLKINSLHGRKNLKGVIF